MPALPEPMAKEVIFADLDVNGEELTSIRVVQDIADVVHRKQSETRVP